MINTRKLKWILDQAPEVDRKLPRQWIPEELKAEVRERDKYRCVVCKREKSLKVHHMKPYGESSIENLIIVCNYCHEYIHKILKRKGYPYLSPAMVIKLQQERVKSFR